MHAYVLWVIIPSEIRGTANHSQIAMEDFRGIAGELAIKCTSLEEDCSIGLLARCCRCADHDGNAVAMPI